MDQCFVIVQRKLYGDDKVYLIGNDLIRAICFQKALIATDNPTEDILLITKNTIKDEEINQVVTNLEQHGRDRLCNDEEEVYILFFPSKTKLR